MAEALEERIIATELKAEEAEMIAVVSDPNLRSYDALSQAPFIITSLGHLLLISAEKDFSLIEHTENTTFQYIKYPDSFRACLVQLSNNVWKAFDAAHHGMNRIYMKAENIDKDVKKAVHFIEEGTKKELPIVSQYLSNIEKQSIECVEAAKSITDEFKEVANMMDELLEACAQSKGKYHDEQNKIQRKKNAALKKQEQIKKDKKELEKWYEKEGNEVAKAKLKYDESVESYPSPWKIMLFGFIDGAAGLARDVAGALIPAFLLTQGMPVSSASKPAEPGSSKPKPVRAEITSDEANAYLAASDILKHAEQLHFKRCNQSSITSVKTSFEQMLGDLNLNAGNRVEDAVKKAMKLCRNGAQISKELGEAENETTKVAIENRIAQFYEKAKAFNLKAVENLKGLSTLSGFQQLANDNENHPDQSQKTKGFLSKTMLEEAERKRKEAKELLFECYRRYERCHNQILQESKEMEKVLDELAKFDHRTLDLNNIRHVLARGMSALNQVIQHWNGFKSMFQELHDIIKERLKGDVQRFKNTTKAELEANSRSEITRREIIEESMEARQIAHVVKSISSLYVYVSKSYLLGQILRLQTIIPLSPEKDRGRIEQMRIKLKEDSKNTKKRIEEIAREKKRELSKKIGDLPSIP
ncbi:Hypothetical predicted protein [Paramuricea clavata]|uniref:Uncharacterized protein n=1 Tax=Paramuricea clavata TaxID=317549 RepID=A0A7D9LE44_PARCT|nr:Hypothetical predicted protein [Paramuricea clavata]